MGKTAFQTGFLKAMRSGNHALAGHLLEEEVVRVVRGPRTCPECKSTMSDDDGAFHLSDQLNEKHKGEGKVDVFAACDCGVKSYLVLIPPKGYYGEGVTWKEVYYGKTSSAHKRVWDPLSFMPRNPTDPWRRVNRG